MSTICSDQHKLLSSSSPRSNKPFKDIEIPPRKLLLNSKKPLHHHHNHHHHQEMMFYPEEINSLHKFLPFNNTDSDSDPDSDPYASDHFRMYEFKIRRCTRSRSHDWTDCPFAHPGEKARRRDPHRYHYSGTVCSEYRRGGGCSRGDDCEFAHGVFECWLHPSRYRTEACKDGKNCKRKVCFFAHSPRQLRILPEIPTSPKYSPVNPNSKNHHHCCMFCHNSVNSSSPTSTLLGMSQMPRSPSLSPPLSPVKHSFSSPISRYNNTTDGRLSKFSYSSGAESAAMTYKDVLNELMSSLDTLNFTEVSSPNMSATNVNLPWLDVSSFNIEDQPQFVLSPSTPSPSGSSSFNSFTADHHHHHQTINNDDVNGGLLANNSSDPDIGWVNDLLM
ncbi:hypothetical protein Q3G72_009215 [Acer saccharum]|nr:hypothetical protein Q3G72_009215 [Acer saccharum]